jgi:hypothetical protein
MWAIVTLGGLLRGGPGGLGLAHRGLGLGDQVLGGLLAADPLDQVLAAAGQVLVGLLGLAEDGGETSLRGGRQLTQLGRGGLRVGDDGLEALLDQLGQLGLTLAQLGLRLGQLGLQGLLVQLGEPGGDVVADRAELLHRQVAGAGQGVERGDGRTGSHQASPRDVFQQEGLLGGALCCRGLR